MINRIKVADLFSGCGGFSEGFSSKDYRLVFSLDFHKDSCETHKYRLLSRGYNQEDIERIIVNKDIRMADVINHFKHVSKETGIDLLLAGIPCQTFSSVGKAQDKNAMKNDERNWLYKYFLKYLEISRPKVFIIENVRGILSSKRNGVNIFDDISKNVSKLGYKILDDKKKILLNAVNFSIPQDRKRIFLIGIDKSINICPSIIYDKLKSTSSTNNNFTVKDAISDLPKLLPGQGEEEINFISQSNNLYIKKLRNKNFNKLYNHVCRKHNDNDILRYKYLSKNNWNLLDLYKIKPELVHHDPAHFKNRYTVQTLDKPGRTIVSHLHKDGNLFIHPDYKQHRTFTVREAARIQSFSDDFRFYGARTSQFIQVGNAVPPMLSKIISNVLKNVIFK